MCVSERVSKEMSERAVSSEHGLVGKCPESKMGGTAFANASGKAALLRKKDENKLASCQLCK